jgi:hypothetical protein
MVTENYVLLRELKNKEIHKLCSLSSIAMVVKSRGMKWMKFMMLEIIMGGHHLGDQNVDGKLKLKRNVWN